MSSIAALAIRLSAIRLLEGQTLAGDRVFDSAIAPIDSIVADGRALFAIVSTGEEEATTIGRDVLAGDRSIDLIVEIAAAERVQGEVAGGDDVVIPQKDGGLELSLGLASRQAMRALFEPATDTAWSPIFRALVAQVRRVQSRRGVSEPDSARFAARQIILTLQPLDEPLFGEDPAGVWADFIAALEADAELSAIAPLISATIKGDPIPEWDQGRAAALILPEGADAIGIGAVMLPGEEPAPADEGTLAKVDDDGNVVGTRTYTTDDVEEGE